MDNESRLFKTGFFLSAVASAKADCAEAWAKVDHLPLLVADQHRFFLPMLVADQQRISSYLIIPI
jgi:hypothetical protein